MSQGTVLLQHAKLALSATGALLMTAFANIAPAAAEEIPIGATLPLSGTGAVYGKSMLQGLELGLKQASAKLDGVTFRLIARDSQDAAGPAVTEARKLMGDDHVPVVVTAYAAPPLAQLKISEQYKVPLMNGGGNTPDLAGKKWLFNDAFMVTQGGYAMMKFTAENLGVKKLSILIDTNYAAATGESYNAIWKKLTGNDATVEFIPFDATDAGPYLDKLLADKPGALFLSVGGTTLSLVLTQLTQRKLPIPVVSNDGALIAAPEANSANYPIYYAAPAAAASAALTKDYKSAYTGDPDFLAVQNYNLGLIVGQVVGKLKAAHKEIDGANFEAVLDDPKNTYIVDGDAKTSLNSQHIAAQDASIVKVENGKSTVAAQNIATGSSD
jgi:ABC-type branched-subunit amino acid transport system substrate-binding protein